jgi:hypothetical protein
MFNLIFKGSFMTTLTAPPPAKVEDKKSDTAAPLTFSNAAKGITAAVDTTDAEESALDWTKINYEETNNFTNSESSGEQHHVAFQLEHVLRPRNP